MSESKNLKQSWANKPLEEELCQNVKDCILVSDFSGGLWGWGLDGLREENKKKKIMTFFCVVEMLAEVWDHILLSLI